MTDDVDKYRLDDHDNERIFRTWIVPDRLAHLPRQQQPTVVFLIGQQGAGKTRVGDQVADQLKGRGGFATIDSDLYKPYHPQYAQLLAEDDTMMAAYTGPDGTRWMAKVQEYVREHRLDAIVHETVQNPPYLVDAMRAYRDAGYRVEAHAMGVPRALSQQGILHRYHQQVRTRGHGRLTVPAKADASYAGILEGADAIDKHHLADLVAVYRRGEATPRYLNTLDDNGQWSKPPALRTAIETERSRTLSSHELAEFQRTQTQLRGEMGDAWRSDLDQVDQLASEVTPQDKNDPSFPLPPSEAARRRPDHMPGTLGRPLRPQRDPRGREL